MEERKGIRINKYLSEIGYCSRRAADRLIELGKVTINGKKPVSATKVGVYDKVRIDGNLISEGLPKPVYLAFNKPTGIVTTTDTKNEKDNIIEFVNYPRRIFPVGRLDKDSEGLIFLTSDGDIVNKILRAGNNHEKEYLVTVNKSITDHFIEKMAGGLPIMGSVTKKCLVEKTGPMMFKIVLTQGLNRQIRRMCEHLGYDVRKLKRTRIMNIKLDVPPGQWRDMTDSEISEIQKLVANSSKTAKTARKKSTPPAKRKSSERPAKSVSRIGKSKPAAKKSKSDRPPFGRDSQSKSGRKSKSSKSRQPTSRGGKRPR